MTMYSRDFSRVPVWSKVSSAKKNANLHVLMRMFQWLLSVQPVMCLCAHLPLVVTSRNPAMVKTVKTSAGCLYSQRCPALKRRQTCRAVLVLVSLAVRHLSTSTSTQCDTARAQAIHPRYIKMPRRVLQSDEQKTHVANYRTNWCFDACVSGTAHMTHCSRSHYHLQHSILTYCIIARTGLLVSVHSPPWCIQKQ